MQRLAEPGADQPLLEPDRLFERLAGARGLVLAVSGGPDSTALMVLAARWKSRPPCLVVCVDHALRPEAADEAQLVSTNAGRLGLGCRIMRAPPREVSGNLQDWARRLRYRCLTQAAREANCDAIVTAHHLEDQAETFLMRLARGSGVYGLAGMADEGAAEGMRLVRPLLGVQRAELARVALASGLPIVTDPSNADPAFERVRLRRLLPELAGHGMGPQRLAATAGRLRRAAAALDHYAGALLSEVFQADRFGVVSGRAEALAAVPEEVGLRVLARVVQATAGASYPPVLHQTEGLLSAVLAAPARFRRTLHGVVATLESGVLRVQREWGREGLATVPVTSGQAAIWDGRFRVEVPAGSDLALAGLGRSTRKLRSNHADAVAIRVLPGLFQSGSLIAVPEGIWADDGEELSHLQVECLVGPRLGLTTAPLITI